MGQRFGYLRQRGDTIVEVLISLLVISTILVGAFLLSRTSSQNVRDSEEHAQALGLLQGQVELLRTAATVPGQLAGYPSSFCMDENALAVSSSDAVCTVDGLYKLSITSTSSGATTTFRFNVTWDKIGGGTSNEDLVYRIAVL